MKDHRISRTEAKVPIGVTCTRNTEPVQPDLHVGQGVDVLVHAQKVLGEVQSAKRDMEIQSELEENETTFSHLVQALGSADDEE